MNKSTNLTRQVLLRCTAGSQIDLLPCSRLIIAVSVFLYLLIVSPTHNRLCAQQQQIDRLLEEVGVVGSVLESAPFDIITVTEAEGGKSLQIDLLDLPNRKLPASPRPNDRLKCVVRFFPDREYEIAWRDIAKVTLWEDTVLFKAKQLIAEKNYAEAFEHLAYLRENYPNLPNLSALHQDFLFSSARETAAAGVLPHTLSILEELQRRFPEFRKVEINNGISAIASRMIDGMIARQEYVEARVMVGRLDAKYQSGLPVVESSRRKFVQLAASHFSTAQASQRASDFANARQSVSRTLQLDPDHTQAKEFLRDLIETHPTVRVAVFQSSQQPDFRAIADWPSLRMGQLLQTPLFSFKRTGPEGGVYEFAYGSVRLSDDQRELDFLLSQSNNRSTVSNLVLSQAILERAKVGSDLYEPTWASLLQSVSLTSQNRVKIHLRRPHVLPQSLMQWNIASEAPGLEHSLYRVKQQTSVMSSFTWRGASEQRSANQPIEIEERLYAEPSRAISDLVRGDIDVIDRLYPADAQQLRGQPGIQVVPYALPITHFLVPCSENPFVQDVDFRRALLYAIDRSSLLNDEILGGAIGATDRVISGPFPAGTSDSDPLAYAYNQSIEPIPYDPRTAAVLLTLSKTNQSALAVKRKEQPPEIPTLRVGVPNYEAAQVAGQAIIQAWKRVGIESEVVLYDHLPLKEGMQVDFLYVSAAFWEPAIDAQRLLGEHGVAATNNSFVLQSLNQLNAATNWREIRASCQELHEMVANHLPILPLWQISESFAHRNEIKGITARPVGLYQNIHRWRLQFE